MQGMVKEEASRKIISGIRRGRELDSNVWVWSNEEGKRKLIKSYLRLLSLSDDTLVLAPKADKNYPFKEGDDVFVRVNFRSIIFKAKAHKVYSNRMVVSFPKEIMYLEQREFERSDFGVLSRFFCSVEKVDDLTLGRKDFLLKLVDISQGGASFVVKSKDRNLIRKEDPLQIHSLGDFKLPVSMDSSVTYISQEIHKEDNIDYSYFKMGVQFKTVLPENVFEMLLTQKLNPEQFS